MISEGVTTLIKEVHSEKTVINIAFGIILMFFAFIMVLYSIFGSNTPIKVNSDFFLLTIVIIINLVGYLLVLLPVIPEKIRYYFNNYMINAWLIIPLILSISLILIELMGPLKEGRNINNLFILTKYYLYVLVPVTIVMLSRFDSLKKIFKDKLFDVVIFLFILFWTWWGIEFTGDLNLFPDLVVRFGYFLNLLAITTLTWSFFILEDYKIKRSFSRLFTPGNFKVIMSWLAVLLVIIVPIGLLVSFLQVNFDNLLNKGFFGAIGYLFLAVIGVFLVQGIGEELLFRGLFYFTLMNKIKELSEVVRGYVMITLFFIVAGLIALTPYVGLANNIKDSIVSSDTIPLKIIYPVIAIIYFAIGIIFMLKTKNLIYTMVLWSSMLFGWAHFEDWRYLIFATIAGIGYCETYRRTNNLFAASVLHMLVDVTWGAVLSA